MALPRAIFPPRAGSRIIPAATGARRRSLPPCRGRAQPCPGTSARPPPPPAGARAGQGRAGRRGRFAAGRGRGACGAAQDGRRCRGPELGLVSTMQTPGSCAQISLCWQGLAWKVFNGQWKKMRKRRVWLPLGGSGPAKGPWLVEMWSCIGKKRRLLLGPALALGRASLTVELLQHA
ncbi:uncharacterized protein ACIQIH_006738 [Cyanocitta cristata]